MGRSVFDHELRYQATIVRELGQFFANGSGIRGKKPVYWCASCVTALAEAEVEYADSSAHQYLSSFRQLMISPRVSRNSKENAFP